MCSDGLFVSFGLTNSICAFSPSGTHLYLWLVSTSLPRNINFPATITHLLAQSFLLRGRCHGELMSVKILRLSPLSMDALSPLWLLGHLLGFLPTSRLHVPLSLPSLGHKRIRTYPGALSCNWVAGSRDPVGIQRCNSAYLCCRLNRFSRRDFLLFVASSSEFQMGQISFELVAYHGASCVLGNCYVISDRLFGPCAIATYLSSHQRAQECFKRPRWVVGCNRDDVPICLDMLRRYLIRSMLHMAGIYGSR